MDSTQATAKPKKSVPLSKAQVNYLIKHQAGYKTKQDAAIALGIGNDVMDRIITYGSCAEKTYRKLFPEG